MAALQLQSLSAGYPRHPEVIKQVTVGPFLPGKVNALVGPNAAGKSTLLRSIAGLMSATGVIQYKEENILHAPLQRKAAVMSYMPQYLPQDVELTVIESLISALKVSAFDQLNSKMASVRSKAFDVLEQVGIVELALEPLNQLSGGQRQLVSFAQAIIRKPEILLLDEPTSALDLQHQVAVMQLVRDYAAKGNIVMMVLHDINLATRWADDIIVLHKGVIAAYGTPAAILTPDLFKTVYKVNTVVETVHNGMIQVHVESLYHH
jgi:iron complex transport system ATP-binding protein